MSIHFLEKILLPVAATTLFFAACEKDLPDQPKANQPPETHVFLKPDSVLATTTSRQTIYWWGDDPDGFVSGFIYSFAANPVEVTQWDEKNPAADWKFTTANQQIFNLTFSRLDSAFVLRVRAVDDQKLVDPTPATLRIPVANSPPVVSFVANTDIPDTTFPVAAFAWTGSDLEGEETILKFQYALDDTAAGKWRDLPPAQKSIILKEADGITPGNHAFYLRAIDLAGAVSKIARMPKALGKTWHVRAPHGKVLVVDDYKPFDGGTEFYKAVLDTVVGAHSVLDIRIDRNVDNRPDFLPASGQALGETMKLFSVVIWYAETLEHLAEAQSAIPLFLNAGGKIFFSTLFERGFTSDAGELEFSPAQELGGEIDRLDNNLLISPDSTRADLPALRTQRILSFVRTVSPKPTASVLYRLPPSTTTPPRWTGTPAVAVMNLPRSFVFMTLPLHHLNRNGGGAQMLSMILRKEFGLP
ncbi:MAG: hypothetical protein ALAOOOJD_00400 [bacterium]|nr:hypothetical protein [bacterium]